MSEWFPFSLALIFLGISHLSKVDDYLFFFLSMQVTWDFRFLFQNQCSYSRSCIFSHCIQSPVHSLIAFRHIAPFFSIYFFFSFGIYAHQTLKLCIKKFIMKFAFAFHINESMLCIQWEIIMISMSFLMRTKLTARIYICMAISGFRYGAIQFKATTKIYIKSFQCHTGMLWEMQ